MNTSPEKPTHWDVALAIAIVAALIFVGVLMFLRTRDDHDSELHMRTQCHVLVQDAAANLERAADFAERQQDNGFERGQALGRLTALRTVCAPTLTDPSPEVRRRLARLVDERLTPLELRELARDVSLGRLVDAEP